MVVYYKKKHWRNSERVPGSRQHSAMNLFCFVIKTKTKNTILCEQFQTQKSMTDVYV